MLIDDEGLAQRILIPKHFRQHCQTQQERCCSCLGEVPPALGTKNVKKCLGSEGDGTPSFQAVPPTEYDKEVMDDLLAPSPPLLPEEHAAAARARFMPPPLAPPPAHLLSGAPHRPAAQAQQASFAAAPHDRRALLTALSVAQKEQDRLAVALAREQSGAVRQRAQAAVSERRAAEHCEELVQRARATVEAARDGQAGLVMGLQSASRAVSELDSAKRTAEQRLREAVEGRAAAEAVAAAAEAAEAQAQAETRAVCAVAEGAQARVAQLEAQFKTEHERRKRREARLRDSLAECQALKSELLNLEDERRALQGEAAAAAAAADEARAAAARVVEAASVETSRALAAAEATAAGHRRTVETGLTFRLETAEEAAHALRAELDAAREREAQRDRHESEQQIQRAALQFASENTIAVLRAEGESLRAEMEELRGKAAAEAKTRRAEAHVLRRESDVCIAEAEAARAAATRAAEAGAKAKAEAEAQRQEAGRWRHEHEAAEQLRATACRELEEGQGASATRDHLSLELERSPLFLKQRMRASISPQQAEDFERVQVATTESKKRAVEAEARAAEAEGRAAKVVGGTLEAEARAAEAEARATQASGRAAEAERKAAMAEAEAESESGTATEARMEVARQEAEARVAEVRAQCATKVAEERASSERRATEALQRAEARVAEAETSAALRKNEVRVAADARVADARAAAEAQAARRLSDLVSAGEMQSQQEAARHTVLVASLAEIESWHAAGLEAAAAAAAAKEAAARGTRQGAVGRARPSKHRLLSRAQLRARALLQAEIARGCDLAGISPADSPAQATQTPPPASSRTAASVRASALGPEAPHPAPPATHWFGDVGSWSPSARSSDPRGSGTPNGTPDGGVAGPRLSRARRTTPRARRWPQSPEDLPSGLPSRT